MHKKILYYVNEIEQLTEGNFVFPISCEIDPSNNCMLNCSFCRFAAFRKKEKVDLDWDVYVTLLSELYSGGTKAITFTGGGEPLMHPKFNTMVAFANGLNFELGLITNGVNLHKLESPDTFKFIRVSIDAATPETYKTIKKGNLFDNVIRNIEAIIDRSKVAVGLSYVVCKENRDELEKASILAKELGVAYIQFKPAWTNHKAFTDYVPPEGAGVIVTERYIPEGRLPCTIAGLVGVVGADANLYFCCQHRGNPKYRLGSLKKGSFINYWKERMLLQPNVERCPQCRYMNYAKEYEELTSGNTMFFEHKHFL